MNENNTEVLTHVTTEEWIRIDGILNPIHIKVDLSLEWDLRQPAEYSSLPLSAKRLAEIRHGNTNYEFLLQDLRRSHQYTLARYEEIKTCCNNILTKLWNSRVVPILAEHQLVTIELERQLAAIEQELRHEEAIRREEKAAAQARRKIQEQVREEQVKEQQHREARYAYNAVQIQKLIPLDPNHPTWANPRRKANVLWTGAFCDQSLTFFQCAVVDDACVWPEYNASGCKNYSVKNGDIGSFSTVTVVKKDAPLAQKLLRCHEVGMFVTVSSRELVVVNVGGGKIPTHQTWNDLLNAVQTLQDEQKSRQKEMQLEQEHRQEQLKIKDEVQQEKRKEEERQERERTAKQTANPISLQEAKRELCELEEAYMAAGSSVVTLREKATHLRFRLQKGLNTASSQSSDATGTGAIIGGLLGLFAGPLGAVIGAGIGAAVGGSNTKPSEQDQWAALSAELDDFLNKLY